jgi:hypothetical protein
MFSEEATAAETVEACVANHAIGFGTAFLDYALAVLSRAEFGVRVSMCDMKLVNFPVLLLYRLRQLLEEGSLSINRDIAKGVWAGHFLELVDSINGVLVHALFTILVLMLAFAYVYFLVVSLVPHADLTLDRFLQFPSDRGRQFLQERSIFWNLPVAPPRRCIFLPQNLPESDVFWDMLECCEMLRLDFFDTVQPDCRFAQE